MSNDLINRDMVINAVVRNCRLKTENGEEYGFIDILSDIADFPTAYDVDKVIERLQMELSLADGEKEQCAKENPLQFDVAKGYAQGISVALEIVKSGGVSDD